MAETYPLTFPSTVPIRSVSLTARHLIGQTVSPYTLTTQQFKFSGQRWEGTIQFPPMKRDDAEVLNAFLVRLQGAFGSFRLIAPEYTSIRGAAGYALIDGASQTGDEIDVDFKTSGGSATGSLTDAVKVGQYIQLGSDSGSPTLHKVLESVDANSSSKGTIKIFPGLRSSPGDTDTVSFTDPMGTFRLQDNAVTWNVDEAMIYSTSIAIAEVI